MGAMNDALRFLIETCFMIYLTLLAVRVLLAYAGANYFDPFTQFIARCTDKLVKPLRSAIPNVAGIEVSTLLIMYVLCCIKLFIISALYSFPVTELSILLIAIADMLTIFIRTLMYAIMIQALMSWMQPNSASSYILQKVTSPILRPIQRVCPSIGGMDISPIPALILLQLLLILIVKPITLAGAGVMFG